MSKSSIEKALSYLIIGTVESVINVGSPRATGTDYADCYQPYFTAVFGSVQSKITMVQD